MYWIGKKSIIIIMFIVLIVLSVGCAGQEKEKPFTIAVIPTQAEGDLQIAMSKLSGILKEKLDREVEIEVYPDYNAVVEAMNFEQVNMAFFGPLTYVIAHHESGAEAIVTQLINGSPFYHSYIITHVDHPWNSLEELLGDSQNVSFAFGDPNSTSGSLIPGMELKERGVYTDPNDHQFEEVRFTGSHDVTALAVENKQIDSGAVDSAIYDVLVAQGKLDGDQIKIIWKSAELFQYPWAVKKGTDQTTIDQLREAFLAIEDKQILDAFGASAFAKAENKDYESIRKAAEQEGRLRAE
jgi:phosphonate transport system substrate-binding protein